MVFAVAPLSVYFGRTFQAEALLLFCAAAALECMSLWRQHRSRTALVLSWIGFTSAPLIKVLPLLWLGLPLLIVQLIPDPHSEAETPARMLQRFLGLIRSPGFWIYLASTLLVVSGWYWHAHQLGQSSGLSFGFWGSDSDRSSLDLLLSAESWFNLAVRIVIRLLAVVGLPFLVLGIRQSWTSAGGRIAISGLAGLALCTIATMRSSTVHDYYQLPLLLFMSPLVGLGWQHWQRGWQQQDRRLRWQPMAVLVLWFAISITVLSLDYWAIEQRQARDWLPLALNIRKTLPPEARIVSVTSTDPTLLNLARRQGWLISAKQLNPKRFAEWDAAGATHLAGSFQWEKMYRPMHEQRRLALQELAASTPGSWVDPISNTYLIPLKGLPRRSP